MTSLQRGTKVSYSYDNNGNRTSVGTPGNSTSYTYDARNRVKTATANSAKTDFDYYPDGKKKSADYPNGAKEEYAYFTTNRVKTLTNSISGTIISKFDYSYDRNGNRKTQDETRGARSISTTYDYDTLDRMTNYSVTENSAVTKTDYTFDGYNRKTETITKPDNTTTTKSYSYDETDWLTEIKDGTKTITYSYDNNGNTVLKTDSSDSANPISFEYDARDKLTRTTKGAAILGRYVYNANGYRIRQLGSDRGDVEYIYDDKAVIEERNGTGLLAHYRYANKLYSLFDGTSNQYYHQDALGSTVDLTDDAGATKASYFLNPWGMILESIGQSVNRRVFTGKEIDQNTGLIYFGARYYDPDTARFTTQDTYLGKTDEPPSLHKYLYAYSNPTVYIDLEGYESNEINSAGMPELQSRSLIGTEIAPATYGLLSKASKDKQERLTEYSVSTSPAKAKILGTAELVILLGPLAPVAGEAGTAAYITAESSPVVTGLAKGIGAYHVYKMATDPEYRGEAMSMGYAEAVAQPVGALVEDIRSAGAAIKAAKDATIELPGVRNVVDFSQALGNRGSIVLREGKVAQQAEVDFAQAMKNAHSSNRAVKYYKHTKVSNRSAITDGKYTTDPVGMARHKPGTAPNDRSVFKSNVDAEKATLDAARFADEHNLWNAQNKAKVPVKNGTVGYLSDGTLTQTVNVYRRKSGSGYLIHGTPGSNQ